MPRPRRSTVSNELSPGQASYVLHRLLSERRVSAGDVNRYLSEMHNEISDLQRKLDALRAAAGGTSAAVAPPSRRRGRPPGAGAAKAAAPATAAGAAPVVKRRRQKKVTAEQAASRILQGRYLALVRQIPPSRRPSYAKIAKESGREAAIKQMEAAIKK